MAFALCAIFCNVYYIVHWSSTVTVMVKSHGAFGASLSVISEHGRQHRGERAQQSSRAQHRAAEHRGEGTGARKIHRQSCLSKHQLFRLASYTGCWVNGTQTSQKLQILSWVILWCRIASYFDKYSIRFFLYHNLFPQLFVKAFCNRSDEFSENLIAGPIASSELSRACFQQHLQVSNSLVLCAALDRYKELPSL